MNDMESLIQKGRTAESKKLEIRKMENQVEYLRRHGFDNTADLLAVELEEEIHQECDRLIASIAKW